MGVFTLLASLTIKKLHLKLRCVLCRYLHTLFYSTRIVIVLWGVLFGIKVAMRLSHPNMQDITRHISGIQIPIRLSPRLYSCMVFSVKRGLYAIIMRTDFTACPVEA